MEKLSSAQIINAGLADWRKLARALHGRFLTGDFAGGLAFVTAVAEAAEEANHHPDVTLTYPWVDLKLISHDAGGLTQRDLNLAGRISEIARERGIAAEPRAVTGLELALDTADLAAVGPFWAAVLAGSPAALQGDDVVDPTGQLPLLWFQHTDADETPRQRFHLDLWIPPDVADERIRTAVAAGGRVVDDSQAPAFTVLADPEGNKVCVCTFLDR
ncbi:4a-hydroxytetrahydrobiopterin dehydratase [Paeniglutamicibacter antarcticus]|uniref:Putative pterin-4-alpha-carbinolamine dehydratase n=1 Tax=Arthrobacter terrae TaxID=2935737 RepID=A0A931CLU2_9MICC|nr:4a-hydroxytetrahydrobiopterin dehydratase [Arthrobacter terrae]MBG0739307.1 4a-hydroxytetrahydrobiopterin dehydratase [Arthrobacter terrae]